jgi:hypothetical protein
MKVEDVIKDLRNKRIAVSNQLTDQLTLIDREIKNLELYQKLKQQFEPISPRNEADTVNSRQIFASKYCHRRSKKPVILCELFRAYYNSLGVILPSDQWKIGNMATSFYMHLKMQRI